MPSYIIVDIETGQVKNLISAPVAVFNANQHTAGELWLEGTCNDEITYYDGAVLAPRPTNPATLDKAQVAADGVDTATLSGLPDPCTVSISGPASAQQEVTGGTLELTFDYPGQYAVTVSAFPYLDAEMTVEVL